MANENNVVTVGLAAERFFRLYHAHCTAPSQDTLFSLLEAGHSLNDRMKRGTNLNFFDFPEFTALKCLRNYFHHQQELRHVVRLIPIANYPIVTDLAVLCLVPAKMVEAAIDETPARHLEAAQKAARKVFHWYGSVVNINPSLFNFVVLAYEHLRSAEVTLSGSAFEEFEVSYRYEVENGFSHFVDGTLSTLAGSVSQLLDDIMSTKFSR
ncbi:hypothetical protein [Afipia carboxidovorans]|jgi:hypothetical protein|nr:hypothetical protein [Afipia carboxidovorans]